MRDLTEEELKLAPDWTTHYIVDTDDSVIYESADYCWWVGLKDPLNNTKTFNTDNNKPLPKILNKSFDITRHEIVDYGYIGVKFDKNLYVKKSGFTIDKSRAIAIAKHLGLTAEDLK